MNDDEIDRRARAAYEAAGKGEAPRMPWQALTTQQRAAWRERVLASDEDEDEVPGKTT